MARRLFNGRAFSENGWPYVDAGSCTWVRIPGAQHVSLQIQNGPPLQILRAFAADFHAYVEPLRDADSAAWTPGNSVATSNHPGGTAMDLNWQGADGKTFRYGISKERAYPGDKARKLDELLDFYEGVVFCGGEWSIRDWMHFQLGAGTYDQRADRPTTKTTNFVARKIRPDGFSTFRRDAAPAPAAVDVLTRAMAPSGVSRDRLAALLPAVTRCLTECGCTTIDRIAMWCAQIGHESGGLRYMEEIASGAAYEGRIDLGNTQPGDGVRFKGRGPIQVTGRGHYTELSKWAHGKGLVPSPTFFVDQPAQLAGDRYGFIGVTWYWTTQRPMNALIDAGDNATWGSYRGFAAVTAAINGGTNGIDDRRDRYQRALALGDQLLALVTVTTPEPHDPLEELLMSDLEVESLSIYAPKGESKIPLVRMVQNIDAALHRDAIVEPDAELGDPDALMRMLRTARGEGKYGTLAGPVNHAKAKLAQLAAKSSPVLLYLAQAAADGDGTAREILGRIDAHALTAFLDILKGN